MEPTLAQRLLHFLKRSKLSRAELARRVGVKPSAVTAWLSEGGSSPEFDNLSRAVAEMGVTMHEFFGPLEDGADEPPADSGGEGGKSAAAV